MFAFLLPFFCFPTLYMIHQYYLIANGVFLILAAGLLLTRVPWVTLLVVAMQLTWFYEHYDLRPDTKAPELQIAAALKAHTKPDEVVMIYGDEWNPMIAYYAQRRAVMEPLLAPLKDVIARGQHMLDDKGGFRVGAIVRCECKAWDGNPEYEAMFARIGMKPLVRGCEVAVR